MQVSLSIHTIRPSSRERYVGSLETLHSQRTLRRQGRLALRDSIGRRQLF